TGCDVEASAFATIAYSRALRVAAFHFPRAVSRLRTPIPLLNHKQIVKISIESPRSHFCNLGGNFRSNLPQANGPRHLSLDNLTPARDPVHIQSTDVITTICPHLHGRDGCSADGPHQVFSFQIFGASVSVLRLSASGCSFFERPVRSCTHSCQYTASSD